MAALARARMTRLAFSFLIFTFAFLIAPPGVAQTSQPAPAATAVMVNSNGVVIAPANFAAVNGFGTNGGGLSSNLPPGRIWIGNTLSNATPQTLTGDVQMSATNGATALVAIGLAGTYAQTTFDAKGRETSGVSTLPVNAGGTGQTTAGAALAALGAFQLGANNVISVASGGKVATNMFPATMYLNPTNAYTPTNLITAASFQNTVTGPPGTFAGWCSGYQFVVNGNQQYYVHATNNDSTIQVHAFGGGIILTGFTNVTMLVYPPALVGNNVNGSKFPAMAVESDGTVSVQAGADSLQGGGQGFRINDGANGWDIIPHNNNGIFGKGLDFQSDAQSGGDAFWISSSAQYRCLWILGNGVIDVQFGFTNFDGTSIPFYNTISGAKGIATLGTSSGTITATGWTNLTGTNIMVDFDASSSTVTNFDNAGNPWRTNASLTGNDLFTILQPGGALKASGGLSGTWHVE